MLRTNSFLLIGASEDMKYYSKGEVKNEVKN